MPVPTSKFVEEGNAVVRVPVKTRPRRAIFRRLPFCFMFGFSPLCLDISDPYTLSCGFIKRVLSDIPEPEFGILEHFAKYVYKYVRKTYKPVVVMSFTEWLATTSYTQEQKEDFILVEQQMGGRLPELKECSRNDSFGKTESYPQWKTPRLINSRIKKFKVFSGRFFKTMENEVYKDPHFIKHVPVPDRPPLVQALKIPGMYYYCTDYTSFESHFIPQFMRVCECVLYSYLLGDSLDSRFINNVLTGTNRMYTNIGVKAKVQARRMSGDMCTSLGNGFTNLMLMKYVVWSLFGKCQGFVEGDDGIFASTVKITAEDFARLGWRIKLSELDTPCEAAFCGLTFSSSGQIVRDPYKFMCSFAWTSSFIHSSEKVMLQLLRAKALSALYESPSCPVVYAIARYALKQTEGIVPYFVYDGYHQPRDIRGIPSSLPSIDTRLLFERMYGISVDYQIILENMIFRGDFSFSASLPYLIKSENSFTQNFDPLYYSLNYIEDLPCAPERRPTYVGIEKGVFPTRVLGRTPIGPHTPLGG